MYYGNSRAGCERGGGEFGYLDHRWLRPWHVNFFGYVFFIYIFINDKPRKGEVLVGDKGRA